MKFIRPASPASFQQKIGGDGKQLAERDDPFQVGLRLSRFPLGYRLAGDVQFFGQLFLGQAVLFSQLLDAVGKILLLHCFVLLCSGGIARCLFLP